ncbi:hypothetical protein WUBG_15162, partial [Wuchereria bancrofti]
MHDCHPSASCTEVAKPERYTCSCRNGYSDMDLNKPGRICKELVNECTNSHLNNCSRFADCIDREIGYECVCKTGYRDRNPAKPGTNCTL